MNISKEEVLRVILSRPVYNCQKNTFKTIFPEIYNEILKINFPLEFKFTQKLYHYIYDDLELKLGLCPICGKRCKFRSFNFGYQHHCSTKCSSLDKTVQEKSKQTCQERFGCDFSICQ